ncbi:hypothetical protein TKK_0011886 [Trichogramma kaykai]
MSLNNAAENSEESADKSQLEEQGDSSISDEETAELTPEQAELRAACQKKWFLDGKYFKVDLLKSKPSSSNFLGHLKRKHGVPDYEEHKAAKKSRLSCTEKTYNRTTCSFDREEMKAYIIEFILDNQLPYSFVEKESFRKIFDCTRVRQESEPFLQLTRYQINPDDFSHKSAALSCKRFPGSHTFDAVADMLESLYLQFGLTTDKVVGTVTDNGSNFVKAFREFAIDDFEPHCKIFRSLIESRMNNSKNESFTKLI